MGTKKEGFTKDPNEEILGNHRFRAREASHPCYYASRGKNSSYLGLFFTFWVEKLEYRVLSQCSSPRRMELRLGEGMYLL